MKPYRRYAFPPLARLLAGEALGQPEAIDATLTEEVLDDYRRAGYEDGHAVGLAEGAKAAAERAAHEAHAALEALREPFDAMVGGFAQLQRDYRQRMREQIASLVEQVARQVIRTELDARPEQILAFVEEALADLSKPADDVQVRLHPEEYQRVFKASPKQARRLALSSDPQLAPGECRVTAGDSELDVGCGQRLAACMEQIQQLLRTESAAE